MTAADVPDPSEPVVLPDDLLPGAEATEPGLLDTLRHGGWSICATAIPLVALEQLTREATTTLAPDIRDYFGISAAFLTAMAGLAGVALTVGGIPMAWLADRVNRKHLVRRAARLRGHADDPARRSAAAIGTAGLRGRSRHGRRPGTAPGHDHGGGTGAGTGAHRVAVHHGGDRRHHWHGGAGPLRLPDHQQR
ncbi:hypothetical protein ACIBKY_37515 [Nonomuraea sp. NPDC050394]|uniref:hypothetical protein n=1 Tax=Nonomuraea sp. NPDC050394 TaxID=3364363 RepID=UPI0037900EA2